MKKNIFLILFNFLSIYNVLSQVEEIKKIDLNAEEGGAIVNLGKHGIAVKTNEGFDFYDINLEKSGSVKLKSKGIVIKGNFCHYDSLLENIVIINVKEIFLISPVTEKIKTIKLEFPYKRAVGWFIKSIYKVGKTYFVEFYGNNQYGGGILNIEDGNVTEINLPKEWTKKYYSIMRLNSKYLAINYFDPKLECRNIALMNSDGIIEIEKLLLYEEPIIIKYNLSISDIGNNQFLISGNYYENHDAWIPSGLFLAKIEEFKQSFIEYYNFNSIKNVNKYKPEKKGPFKEGDPDYNYSIQIHPSVKIFDNYVIAAEFSLPTSYDPKSEHNGEFGLFLVVNEAGKQLESDCVPLYKSGTQTNALKLFNIKNDGEFVNYSYIQDNKIQNVIIDDNTIDISSPITLIENKYESPEVITEIFNSNLWYGNFYYGMLRQKQNKKYKFMEEPDYTYKLIKYELKED